MTSASTTTTSAAAEHVPSETAGLGALGINASALLFQVINFLLLLIILRWAVYKPLLKVLRQRRELAEEALANADAARQAKGEAEAQRRQALQEAEREATLLVTRARQQADAVVAAAREQGKADAERLQREADATITAEAAKVSRELRRNMMELVARAASFVLKKKLDSATDKELLKEAMAQAQRQKV